MNTPVSSIINVACHAYACPADAPAQTGCVSRAPPNIPVESGEVRKYSAEREDSRFPTFSLFGKYLCHTKSYNHKQHIKTILNPYWLTRSQSHDIR